MDKHAQCAPSKMSRIISCPGSIALRGKLPESKSSAAAEEGTYLHDVTAYCLTHQSLDFDRFDLDNDQKIAVRDCYEYAQILFNSMRDGHTVMIEQRVSCLPHGVPECWGTMDLGLHDYTNKHVHIIDWKFGKGVPVYALKNTQGLCYASGYADPDWLDEYTFTIHVVQPRIGNYDTWEITGRELKAWIQTVLKPAVIQSKREDAPRIPGANQCQWCSAAPICPEKHEQAGRIAEDVFTAHLTLTQPDVDIKKLVELLDESPTLTKYLKDIAGFLQGKAEEGLVIPGKKLVRGRGSRRWLLGEKETSKVLLAIGCEIDQIYPSKFITPPAAEKLKYAYRKDTTFQLLIEKVPGSLTLVNESDKRKAVDSKHQAKAVFEQFGD